MVIDASVVIRFLVNDDPLKAEKFEKFLTSKRKGTLSDVTVAEILWTLKSFYKVEKQALIDSLKILLSRRGIICDKRLLLNALSFYENYNVSFIDAYVSAVAIKNKSKKVLSFDKDFDKIKGIKRIEP